MTVISEPGVMIAATIGKAAEDGSPGTRITGAGQGLATLDPDMPLQFSFGIGFVSHIHHRAEAAQHPFGVVARRFRLDDLGDAVDAQTGQQDRRLDPGPTPSAGGS